jgi:hypothetical protein
MVNVLASRAIDREFEPRSGQTKDYAIGMCCFSALSESRAIINDQEKFN